MEEAACAVVRSSDSRNSLGVLHVQHVGSWDGRCCGRGILHHKGDALVHDSLHVLVFFRRTERVQREHGRRGDLASKIISNISTQVLSGEDGCGDGTGNCNSGSCDSWNGPVLRTSTVSNIYIASYGHCHVVGDNGNAASDRHREAELQSQDSWIWRRKGHERSLQINSVGVFQHDKFCSPGGVVRTSIVLHVHTVPVWPERFLCDGNCLELLCGIGVRFTRCDRQDCRQEDRGYIVGQMRFIRELIYEMGTEGFASRARFFYM